MSAPLDFGVQSFCFRHFKDNAQVAELVKQIGLSSIEVCAVHADFSDLDGWKKIVKTYNDAGVDVISIGVEMFGGDPSERQKFECAKAAGAKHISAHFAVDSFHEAVPKTAKLAEEFGINVGLHNHGGYMFGGQPDVVKHILELGGPRIGLCMDTAWAMQIGPKKGNPVQWAKDFAGQIHGVHYKDFTFNSDGSHQDEIVGTGNLDLPALLSELEAGGFDGMPVIEYEANAEDPVGSLTDCVNKMRSLAGTPA